MSNVVTARHASTVMVLQDGADGLEVYCVRRHQRLRAWGGAVAFPGGKIEPGDYEAQASHGGTPLHPRVSSFGDPPELARAAVVAAARECFEEACLLPVKGHCPHERLSEMRRRWRTEWGQMLRHERIAVDFGAFVPVGRWVTPRSQPIRFDARFYLARRSTGQVGSHEEEESMDGRWFQPRELLDQFERLEVELVPPTQWMLHMLGKCDGIQHVERFAARQSLEPICPEFSRKGADVRLVLPGHPDHSEHLRSLEGPTSYDLRQGRFALNWKKQAS